MIKVSVFDNIEIIQSIKKDADENIRIAWAQENEQSPGYAVFSTSGEILDIIDNGGISELLVRACLNYYDLRSLKIAFCRNKKLYPFLKTLGFSDNNDSVEVDIKDFFKPCCKK